MRSIARHGCSRRQPSCRRSGRRARRTSVFLVSPDSTLQDFRIRWANPVVGHGRQRIAFSASVISMDTTVRSDIGAANRVRGDAFPGPRSAWVRRVTTTRRSPVLRRAVELGVNHIDTAQYYGPDVSNELIHEALHPYPDDLVLVSKVGAERDDKGTWLPAQRPSELRAGVEDNLRIARDRAARRGQPPPAWTPARGPGDRPCRSTTSSPRWWRCARRARSPASGSPTPTSTRCRQAIDDRGHRLRAEPVQPARPARRATSSTAATRPASPTSRSSRSAPPSPACRR